MMWKSWRNSCVCVKYAFYFIVFPFIVLLILLMCKNKHILRLHIFIHRSRLYTISDYLLVIEREGYVAQLVKNLPAMEEIWVQSLGWEDPLEKGKATHSSILA